jgi:hydroxymethylbilane synthase
MKIRIATRKSPLALWQTNFVKEALLQLDGSLDIVFVELTTQGDREQSIPLTDIGGKSLFVKELQRAVLDGDADIAVHSIKDMSVQDCDGLTLAAICKRDDARDAFLSTQYASIEALPSSAVVGTSSPRRASLLKSLKPTLQTKMLRGNVGTRLRKLDDGEYDAIILATAGLNRLGLDHRITQHLPVKLFVPAIGQAAIGIECRSDNEAVLDLLKQLQHQSTADCVIAERAVNKVLNGNCHTPVAAHAQIIKGQLSLHAMVGSLDGKTILTTQISGSPEAAANLGKQCGIDLLEKGADKIIHENTQ